MVSLLFFSSFYCHLLIFGSAGSLLLRGFVPSRGEQGLFSSCGARASHGGGVSCCEARALGHGGFGSGGMVGSVVAIPRCMWLTGQVALWHVGSSWTRDRTHVSCTGRFFTTEPPGQPLVCGFLASKFFFRCQLQVSF